MSKRVRYDLEMLRGFLRGFCEKEGIKLIGEYLEGKVNTKTRIRGKCLGENCEEEFEKGFRDLVTKTGGYCKTCTKKRAKDKRKQTNLRVRGVEHPSQAEDVKEKMKQTNLERYGVEYSLQAKEVREKGKQTNLERYGVEYSAQNPLISEKTSKNAYKGYNVELPSGNTLHLQGYEIYCLQDLLNEGYEEEDIITSRKDVPEIWYTYRGKRHRYFTDFYIPKDNLLVECKSTHTMEVRFDKNLAKLEAVKALGYKMEIRVYSEKGEVVDRWD